MPTLTWDIATGYDLFISHMALHDPEQFSLRPSWAAGVRARLPTAEREFLQRYAATKSLPLHWVHSLPAPKDSRTVLAELGRIPPAERLFALLTPSHTPAELLAILHEVQARGAWEAADVTRLQALLSPHEKPFQTPATIGSLLDFWARPAEFGELFLLSFESFYSEFFAEEEERLLPYLQAAAEQGQAWAADLPLETLLEELSQGVRYALPTTIDEIVFAPVFWSTPLIIDLRLAENRLLFTYGARPAAVSLVPGEAVPADLPQVLKALADPTRLRILRLLAERPLAPGELAQELRLRPSTLTHHLQALRLARLVRLTLSENDRRVYALRPAGLERVVEMLYQFVNSG